MSIDDESDSDARSEQKIFGPAVPVKAAIGGDNMRLYRNEIRRGTAYDEKKGFPVVTYYEIRYVDIDGDGLVTAIGSEEFTPERLKAATREAYIWTWDGKKLNKGGRRWFENCGLIRYRKNEAREIKQYFKAMYNAEAVELR